MNDEEVKPEAEPPKKKNKPGAGRPSVVTDSVIRKLLEASADGATDVQACLLAEISTTSYYKYKKEHPEFTEQMERATEILKILATRKLRIALESDDLTIQEQIDLAWKILNHGKEGPQQLPSGKNLSINLGNVTQNVIRAEDLNDDELKRLSAGEPIDTVLAGRELATPEKE